MAIYRNEELSIGNHIAIPSYSDFSGDTIGVFKIKKISKENRFNELETVDGRRYHLKEFSDFGEYKDICGE